MIDFTIALATKSEANCRDHWCVKARRAQEQRYVIKAVTAVWLLNMTSHSRIKVRFERATARRPLDDDNLRSALKACRDGVADALGLDDGDPRVTWEYAQAKGKGGTLRVQIERA